MESVSYVIVCSLSHEIPLDYKANTLIRARQSEESENLRQPRA